jgi:hypothetical protein
LRATIGKKLRAFLAKKYRERWKQFGDAVVIVLKQAGAECQAPPELPAFRSTGQLSVYYENKSREAYNVYIDFRYNFVFDSLFGIHF